VTASTHAPSVELSLSLSLSLEETLGGTTREKGAAARSQHGRLTFNRPSRNYVPDIRGERARRSIFPPYRSYRSLSMIIVYNRPDGASILFFGIRVP
jgi:hypothetical protein